MSYNVNNAIILAAGMSSRFCPLSYERPKGLTIVNGEVLIERQIKQIRLAGIHDIYIVVGYKKELFQYLKEKYNVVLIENEYYLNRNNNSSIWTAKNYLCNSYVCSSDNYFRRNPFESIVDDSFYAACFSNGPTNEWCITYDSDNYIESVSIGGSHSWFMVGHTFWSEVFCNKYISILNEVYDLEETKSKLWENIYLDNIHDLKMKIKKYPSDVIYEFDTLEELRLFDKTYLYDSRSSIMKKISENLNIQEAQIINIIAKYNDSNNVEGFYFTAVNKRYLFDYKSQQIIPI